MKSKRIVTDPSDALLRLLALRFGLLSELRLDRPQLLEATKRAALHRRKKMHGKFVLDHDYERTWAFMEQHYVFTSAMLAKATNRRSSVSAYLRRLYEEGIVTPLYNKQKRIYYTIKDFK